MRQYNLKLGHLLKFLLHRHFWSKKTLAVFALSIPIPFSRGVLADKCGVRTIPESAAQEIAGDESPEAFFVHWLE